VRSLTFELPPGLAAEPGGAAFPQNGVRVDFFYPRPGNVAIETLAPLTPQASGTAPAITLDVPERMQADGFALRFSGMIQAPRAGKYTFSTTSDDGSRLYIGEQLVVNSDSLHGMVEQSGTIDLPAGEHPLVVTYFDNDGDDGLHVSWDGPGFRKQEIPATALTIGGGETVHDVAIRATASIPGRDAEKFVDLATLVKRGLHRPAAIHALAAIADEHRPQVEIRPLLDNLIGYLSEIPAAYRTSPAAQEALALAKSLTSRLPAEHAESLLERLENLDVRVIAIGTVPHRMIYDKERIAVQAGAPVEFRFSNTDDMPHNFAIVVPGALEAVGTLAEATARDADAMDRQYIPQTDQILLASRLLQPGQSQSLLFEAPATPGVYPYVCTYPGHWRRMYGALYVVENLEAYVADEAAYLASHPLALEDELLQYIDRNTEWKFEDLAGSVTPLPHGRSFDVGKNLFKVANCVGCHRLNDEGQQLGPDLAKLDEQKHTTEHLLRSLIEPSKDIDEKFQSYTLVLGSGKIVTGMIVEETTSHVKLLIDPLAKRDPLVIEKAEIEERQKSPTSIMPLGLANKLTSEEILDLIAYIYARGDKQHELFETEHRH
jgi:putative heme-binding domain-containing protein